MSLKESINNEIETRFYYIDYPSGTPEKFWKDGHGNLVFIQDMGLDHLKLCIRRIEKDIEDFNRHWAGFSNGLEVREQLFPLVEVKLDELRKAFAQNFTL